MAEEVDKRIELLIEELSDLLQIKSKSGSKEESNKSSNCKESPDFNGLQTTLDSIAILLERDDCDLYFECFYSLILSAKKNLNLVFWINSGDSKLKTSGLTSSNVELNSIWESICYKIEKLITNDMIKNNLDNELDFERVCSQIRFLFKLKDNESDKQLSKRFEIWRLFDAIRVCKLESDIIEFNEKQFDWFLKRIVLIINFELRLYRSGYFGSYCLTYRELIRPYLQSTKTRLETELSTLNTNVDDLVVILKNIIEFDNNLQQIRQEFSRFMESTELDELFEWKAFIEMNININLFNKTIYDEINSELRKLKCFKTNNFEKCFPLKDSNILCCVSQVFQRIENYRYLCVLDSFMTFLSYAISAHILDFFIHHFNYEKYDSIQQKYTLLNTIHYILNKLEKMDINIEKFKRMSDKLVKQLKANHVSILMIANNVEYTVLYLNRLWIELELKLEYFLQRNSIYEFVLSESIHHFSESKLNKNEIIFLLNNSIDLLLKNSYSRKQFLYENRNNIHNSCEILFVKLILRITTNEKFISNLKQNHNLPENLDNNINYHWIQFFRPKLMENSFWLNAKFCVDKQFDSKQTKHIIRAFLSKNCSFSSFVLSNIDFDNTNESLISSTTDIFQLIIWHYFKPNLLSEILLKLIERHNSWPEFDKSIIFNSSPQIWWYTALESLITLDVDNYLIQKLKTLINDSLIGSQVTQEIEELYKSNNLLFKDIEILLEEGLQSIYTIINDLIQTLPITLITSLEILNLLVPEYVSPLSKSITLNVLVSLLLKRLEKCDFLTNDSNESKVVLEFCQKLRQKFIESIESENNLSKMKKSLELKKLEKIDSLNNEEIEFEIIESSIDWNNEKIIKTFERLFALILKYKDIINRNICEKCDSFEITLNKEKDLFFQFNRLTNEDYDYKQILDLIEWKSFENQIKLKFDYLSRLALFEE